MKKLILPLLLLCINTLLHAQKNTAAGSLTPEQKAKLTSIMYELDGKLKPVTSADAKLQGEMQQALKTIAAIKDVKQRSSAIAAYQQKYKGVYSAMVKKAGVDMNKYIAALNLAFPNYQFMLSNEFSIIGTARRTAPPAVPPAGPVTTQIKNFTTTKAVGCGGIGGGDAIFTSNSVKASAFATTAGGCNNRGEMTAQFDVPRASSASITLKHLLKTNAFAVGVLGTGITDSRCVVFSAADTRIINSVAIAPVLWVSSEDDEQNETMTFTVAPNAAQTITYIASVSTLSGLPSEANGDASITGISATLTTRP